MGWQVSLEGNPFKRKPGKGAVPMLSAPCPGSFFPGKGPKQLALRVCGRGT